MTRRLLIPATLLALAVTGCGDEGAVGGADVGSGADAAGDGALDLSFDAGLDPVEVDDADSADDTAPDELDHGGADFEVGADVEADGDPLPAQGPFGPAGRVVSADIPGSVNAARRAGCQVYGGSAGTSMSNVVLLTGGLAPYFRQRADGSIDFVLLIWADGWEEGQRVGELEELDLAFLDGEVAPDRERFVLLGENFPEGVEGPPRSYFPATRVADGGWFETPAAYFELSIPLLGDYVLRMPIRTATARGRLMTSGPGLGVEQGVITGYVARDDVIVVAERLRDACFGEEPPSICNLIGGQIDQEMSGDELVNLVVGFTPGFDVLVSDDAPPRTCGSDEEGCNAMSMCITFRAEGVEVAGVAE